MIFSRDKISAVQNEAVHNQTAGKPEEPLGKLDFRLLRKSAEPIDKEGSKTKEIGILRPWNNYSIIVLQDPREIKIFDESGNQVSDFVEPLNKARVFFDFRKIVLETGKRYASLTSDTFCFGVDELPFSVLQGSAKQIIENNSRSGGSTKVSVDDLPYNSVEIRLKNPDVKIFENGKYIIRQ